MREILFRGKRIDNGEWVLSHIIMVFKDGECQRTFMAGETENPIQVNVSPNGNLGLLNALECGLPLIDDSTIGQYTGLTANGKKIFEGDIISSGYFRNFFVEYSEEDAEYQANFGDSFGSLATYLNPKESTVIGNVHDNYELLDNSELLEDRP